jgi:hypothetical protein
LASADSWVRQQFQFLDDMLMRAGCESRDLSAPGRAYRRDGKLVLASDPKLHWIGLGFPGEMREDVRSSTKALRPQQGLAWFSWSPDSCDRGVVAGLVQRSLARSTP